MKIGWLRILESSPGASLVVAATLAFVAYLPFVNLAALPDDYLQVQLAQQYGPPSGWGELARDPLYRSRATSLVLTYLTTAAFGFAPWILHLTSLLLHVLNTLLTFGLAASPLIGRRVAALGALVFAVRERHHEAVVWYAALPELLVFTFALLTVSLWVRWLKTDGTSADWRWMLTFLCFLLALFSKESAVAIVPLLLLFSWPYYRRNRARVLVALAPFGLSAALYGALVFLGAPQNHHFSDGTFSITPMFLGTFLNSSFRGFWIWGSLATYAIYVCWDTRSARVFRVGCLWAGLALLPYCFVTYMPRVPSRHHYLASAGFALVIAGGILVVRRAARVYWIVPAAVVLLVFHNVTYLWVSKREQFVARSAPIEKLLHKVRGTRERPFRVKCFPMSLDEARRAVALTLREPGEALMASSTEGVSFCEEPAP